MSRFSENLVYLRKRTGLSQQELADKIGCSRSTIGMYETGKREPDLDALESFADVFNVDMDFLINRVESSEWSVRFRQKLSEIVENACQEDLLAAGLDLKELSLIISGSSKLTFDYACDISEALGETLDYMLSHDSEDTMAVKIRDKYDEELISLFVKLSPDEKKHIISHIKFLLSEQ